MEIKYKLMWKYHSYQENWDSVENKKHTFEIMHDIEKLIEFGYGCFKIEILEEEIKKSSQKNSKANKK